MMEQRGGISAVVVDLVSFVLFQVLLCLFLTENTFFPTQQTKVNKPFKTINQACGFISQ